MPEEVGLVDPENKDDKEKLYKEFDDVFENVRSFGTYQRLLYFLTNLICIPLMAQFSSLVFVMGTPQFRCATPNTTCPPSKCCDNCTEYVFKGPLKTTVAEWNLICDRAYLGATLQSCYFVGMLIGSLVGGVLSDLFGRKKCIFFFSAFLTVFGGASSFVHHPVAFAVLRVFVGISLTSVMLTQFVYVMEIVGPRYRTMASNVMDIFWYGGACFLILFAYLLPAWRWLSLVYTLPIALILPFWPWIPETPRWLAANGSLDEAHRILMKFGGSKGKSLDSAQLRALLDQIRQDQIERIVKAKKDTPVDMFRTSKMRKFSLIVCLHWFVTALLGFGIFLFIMQLAGNIYINYFIMRFLTLLRVFLSWLLYAKFGRRLVFGGFMTGAGVICLIVLAIYQDYPLVTTGIAIAVKIMIDCNWAGIYLMTSEVFPTVLRNTAMGMGSCSARIAAILAPYIVMTGQLPGLSLALPVTIFGVCAIVGGIATYWLPETLFAPMRQTVEEADAADDDYRLVCWGKPLTRKGDPKTAQVKESEGYSKVPLDC
ncbi:predicted protein [Nematostella vectensis]|uniref:Major facilitator superfamily (MFS) profile domain-containing protein n=1 Tax=Nematostella vectensis TaxID=45351 RepID=A7S356_NEMVE|nr:organic cation transporter protein [Nematostella vectensis]XP_032239139.1 organic cation transporter protein [Nematostella vectensis]EDO41936.1 predicted protein [Nematostella vectensis]|eukprot:XP_001633999.1 predicted protein [Nematostella vectensis]